MRVTPTLLFASGCLLMTTASFGQSLADVARKEEERRKTQPTASKVYTNKDLADVPPATSPIPAASGGASSTPSDTSASAAKDEKGSKGDSSRGQSYWAGRIKSAREALDHDSTFVDALQSRINALTTDFVNRDDPAQRSTIERDRQKAMGELEKLKAKVAEDRKAIADIEEEARRAGVPPGWLR